MKARLPQGMGGGPQNMQNMLRQAQKMQENLESKRSSNRPERPQPAPHSGKPVHRQRHGCRHGCRTLRTQPAIDHAGYLHPRVR